MGKKQNLIIESSNSSPFVSFTTEGRLKMEGKIIPDNALPFFDVLINWISDLDSSQVIFDINIEYMNTSATMQMFKLLKNMEHNCLIEKLTVNWHYEEGDDDTLETGQILEELLTRMEFKYCEYSETP